MQVIGHKLSLAKALKEGALAEDAENMRGVLWKCFKLTRRNIMKPKNQRNLRRIFGAFFVVWLHMTASGAGSVISASFRDTTAPGWIFGGSGVFTNAGVPGTNTALLTAAAGIDTPGTGWLRLTSTNTYLGGYALYTNAIPSTNSSIFVSLDMAIWGGYADGFVLFFYDASVPFSL